jgi:hypothetical protein
MYKEPQISSLSQISDPVRPMHLFLTYEALVAKPRPDLRPNRVQQSPDGPRRKGN